MPKTQFKVYGPYEIPVDKTNKHGVKRIVQKNISDFWSNQDVTYLSSKRGCYIFALRVGRGYTPYYVGKTHKQQFSSECLTDSKRIKYNDIILNHRGTPVLFFIAKPGNKNHISDNDAKEIEKYLIQKAWDKNPEYLLNRQNTRPRPPGWLIDGVYRSKPKEEDDISTTFRKMMGIDESEMEY